jgi:hypothetical protein
VEKEACVNGKESSAVQVSPSELIPVLWMVIVFVAAASIVSVGIGFLSSDRLATILEVSAGGVGIALSFLCAVGMMILDKLASIEAHMRALLIRLGPRA